jgi:hypothetical protein
VTPNTGQPLTLNAVRSAICGRGISMLVMG